MNKMSYNGCVTGDKKDWITVDQAAEMEGVSRSTVSRWVRDGVIAYKKRRRERGRIFILVTPDGKLIDGDMNAGA